AQEPRAQPQSQPEQKLFTDEHGAFDVSGFLSSHVGFLPLVIPITEPAVGYGLTVGVSYFHSTPPVVGDAQSRHHRTIMPSTTMLFGGGTENGTWALGAAHLGIWDEGRIRYVGAAGYAHLDLEWFGRDQALGGRSVSYTNDAAFLYQSIKFQ